MNDEERQMCLKKETCTYVLVCKNEEKKRTNDEKENKMANTNILL